MSPPATPPRTFRVRRNGVPEFEIRVQTRVDLHISEAIVRYGCWEPFVTDLTRRLLRCGETYVDVGANIGWFTLVAGRLVGSRGKVFAFEPEPENASWLRHNVRLNGLECVRIETSAADRRTGEGWLHRSADNLGDHRIFPSSDLDAPIPIECVRLDDYFASEPGPLDFVKIDTQGAELRVLEGFAARLARDRPTVLTELWPYGLRQAGENRAAERLLEAFDALGRGNFRLIRGAALEPVDRAALLEWDRSAPDASQHLDLLWVPEERADRLADIGVSGDLDRLTPSDSGSGVLDPTRTSPAPSTPRPRHPPPESDFTPRSSNEGRSNPRAERTSGSYAAAPAAEAEAEAEARREDLDFVLCARRAELMQLYSSEIFRRRFMLEAFLARQNRGRPAFDLSGFCLIDQRPVAFRVDWEYADPEVEIDWLSPLGETELIAIPNWRESMVCPHCQLNNRQRALGVFVLRRLHERRAEHGRTPEVYSTERVTPLYGLLASRVPRGSLVGSEYLGPGLRGGTVHDGVRHEDVTQLSLEEASRDLVLSCSVLEHVDRPLEGIAEMGRVLRPGGELLLEIPFDVLSSENVQRARREGGAIVHLEEPRYHGNPVSDEGSLVYSDFGWELIDQIHATGLFRCEVVVYWSYEHGHLGGTQLFFRLWRTELPWIEAHWSRD